MKSKTKISKQLERKGNSELTNSILAAKKNNSWVEVAGLLSRPRRKRINFNLDEINQKCNEGESIIIPGKVLSQGKIEKKIKIIAFNFSEKAKEKLLSSKCQITYISDEIKSNPSAKGLKILK
ncbi:MAG TPA: 50S ribosomal protein L18e [Candidatus Pacearchaeota archaeon]|nr:50S ribosomal protein L18e [Candidatus Pacearchaeota archaeon]